MFRIYCSRSLPNCQEIECIECSEYIRVYPEQNVTKETEFECSQYIGAHPWKCQNVDRFRKA